MDFAALEPAIIAYAQAMCGDSAVIAWADAPDPQPAPAKPLVRLSMPAIAPNGDDELVWAYDAAAASPDAEMVPTASGLRALTVSLQVTTLDQRAGYTARAVLELARTRARMPSALGPLEAAGMALIEIGTVVPAPYVANKRVWSRYVLDVRLAAVSTVTDTAGATSSIASVGVTAKLTNVDGTARADVPFTVP